MGKSLEPEIEDANYKKKKEDKEEEGKDPA